MIENYLLSHPPIDTSLISHTETSHTLVIKPLLPGFGYTFGNSIRRILLSSIPGFSVTAVRINDITHEYQGIEGVVEDAFDIVLNLKGLRVKILTDENTVTLKLSKKSQGSVTAMDFGPESNVKIVNPELYICSLDKGGSIEIEVDISRGTGFQTVDELAADVSKDPRNINVDAYFNPVVNVSLEVEKIRVGEKTDFDKLEINFETDLSQDAKDIVAYALKLNSDIYAKINSSFLTSEPQYLTEASVVEGSYVPSFTPSNGVATPSNHSSSITDNVITLDNKRIKGILEKNGIKTNEELINRQEEVSDFSGISEKSVDIIKEYINSIK